MNAAAIQHQPCSLPEAIRYRVPIGLLQDFRERGSNRIPAETDQWADGWRSNPQAGNLDESSFCFRIRISGVDARHSLFG
jgi:hypothetical protein